MVREFEMAESNKNGLSLRRRPFIHSIQTTLNMPGVDKLRRFNYTQKLEKI